MIFIVVDQDGLVLSEPLDAAGYAGRLIRLGGLADDIVAYARANAGPIARAAPSLDPNLREALFSWEREALRGRHVDTMGAA